MRMIKRMMMVHLWTGCQVGEDEEDEEDEYKDDDKNDDDQEDDDGATWGRMPG